MKKGVAIVLCISLVMVLLSATFVSAGFFGYAWAKITGKAVASPGPISVILLSPANNTIQQPLVGSVKSLEFKFMASPGIAVTILNCSIIINDVIKETLVAPTANVNISKTYLLSVGNYTWKVRCYNNMIPMLLAITASDSETRKFSVVSSDVDIDAPNSPENPNIPIALNGLSAPEIKEIPGASVYGKSSSPYKYKINSSNRVDSSFYYGISFKYTYYDNNFEYQVSQVKNLQSSYYEFYYTLNAPSAKVVKSVSFEVKACRNLSVDSSGVEANCSLSTSYNIPFSYGCNNVCNYTEQTACASNTSQNTCSYNGTCFIWNTMLCDYPNTCGGPLKKCSGNQDCTFSCNADNYFCDYSINSVAKNSELTTGNCCSEKSCLKCKTGYVYDSTINACKLSGCNLNCTSNGKGICSGSAVVNGFLPGSYICMNKTRESICSFGNYNLKINFNTEGTRFSLINQDNGNTICDKANGGVCSLGDYSLKGEIIGTGSALKLNLLNQNVQYSCCGVGSCYTCNPGYHLYNNSVCVSNSCSGTAPMSTTGTINGSATFTFGVSKAWNYSLDASASIPCSWKCAEGYHKVVNNTFTGCVEGYASCSEVGGICLNGSLTYSNSRQINGTCEGSDKCFICLNNSLVWNAGNTQCVACENTCTANGGVCYNGQVFGGVLDSSLSCCGSANCYKCPENSFWNGVACSSTTADASCRGCTDNNGNCLNIGFRIKLSVDVYCNSSRGFSNQRAADSNCVEGFECLSNSCISGKCVNIASDIRQRNSFLVELYCMLRDWLNIENDYGACIARLS